jgi:tetratricopeptide (TPR) repeat protein
MEDQTTDTVSSVAPLFSKVIDQSPGFAPAWDKLLKAEALQVMTEPHSDLSAPLSEHLAEARRRGVDAAGAYLAQSALRPASDFLGRIAHVQRGLEKYPDDARLHGARAHLLTLVGRQGEAVEEALRASELLPLSPAARADYIFILAHSGRYPKAIEELRQAERLWPGMTSLSWTRFSLEMRYGDPRVALKLSREGASRAGDTATEAFLQARIAPTKANVERAVAEQVAVNRQMPFFITTLVQTLATFGRTQEALQVLLDMKHPEYGGYQSEPFFRPTMREVRRDPRFMQAMARMGLASYWRRSGNWPDFCFEPDLPYDCRKEAAGYV